MALLSEAATGVYIIAVTPFTETGALDYESLDRVTDFYLQAGASGITVLGMMGEAPKLSAAEKSMSPGGSSRARARTCRLSWAFPARASRPCGN